MIMNLCINARDAMEGNGKIEIELFKSICDEEICSSCEKIVSGNFLILSVKDSGCDTLVENRPLIFESVLYH